jgi:hypothetical protein
MKIYVGVEVIAPPFLTSALDGDEWSASRLDHFTPGIYTHFIQSSMQPFTEN